MNNWTKVKSVAPTPKPELKVEIKDHDLMPNLLSKSLGSRPLARKRRSRKMRRMPLSKSAIDFQPRVPGVIDTTTTCSHIFRFAKATTIDTLTCSSQDIFGALGGICTVVNSTIRPWASSFRISKIVVFPAGNNSTVVANECDVRWSGANNYQKDSTKNNTAPSGITVGQALVAVPPKDSLAADWINASIADTSIFSLVADKGAILDLHVAFTLSNNAQAATITSVTTATLGNIYYLALDGRSTNAWRPVDLPTTS